MKIKKIALVLMISLLQIICMAGCGKSNKADGEQQNNKQQVENQDGMKAYSWEDFVVDIDGNRITAGDIMSDIETLGYVTEDEDYNNAPLKPKEPTWEIEFEYKDVKGISFSQYNFSQEELSRRECNLESMVIKDTFFKSIDVILPGEIKVDENTTIDDIVEIWGNYTIQNGDFYIWQSDNGMIAGIWINDDQTISEIRYAGWHNSIK